MRFIVFDWDGTLMDSETQIVSCLHGALADMDVGPLDDATVKDVIGLGLREAVDKLVPGSDDVFLDGLVGAYRRHWFASQESSLFEGVREMLDDVRAQGFLVGIATGKARRGLKRVLGQTGLDGYFHATRCSDETQSKPHPQMLLELMRELDVAPGETVMVGDTEYDMAMAVNAGVHRVAVSCGVHEEARLLRHDPLTCLQAVRDLPAWLEQAGHFRR